MEKINKLATIVATAARMEKKAKTGLTEFEKSWKDKLWKNIYYRKQFETVMNYITEEEAKSLCEELEIEHKNQSYKQDLLGKMGSGIDESERIAYLVVLYFIDENKAQEILDKMELQSSKKSNLTKKAAYLDNEVERKKLLYETEKELKKDMQTIDTIIKKIKDSIETSTTKAIKHEKIFHKDEAKNGNDLELSKFWVKMQNLYDEYLQKAKDMIVK